MINTQDLREAAERVTRHCFRKQGDSALMSIPTRPGYDVDLLLADAADEIDQLRAAVMRFQSQSEASRP